ncbi:putative ATP-dependent endonuclease of the OLD family [Chryseobacterium takakiae]|uniref:Putative ATP-dependent endonuclease of the OLD family n=2 Tax=Chryseobacterium takakiae TaxID=1302685 RepID=A0A1M5AXA0_9FLAO|nr:putative ATP-dependent endonuclease of the OLD family [Chryseobacterium takakiae]
MYLNTLTISNFRKIQHLEICFNKGVNLLIGENDAGKSSILDAIRLVTGVHSNDYFRVSDDDFFTDGKIRSNDLEIICEFRGLSNTEAAAFLEWISIDETEYYLKVTLRAKRRDKGNSIYDIYSDVRAGENEESGSLGWEAKNKLRVTYLKPLRDASYELAARRGSRLSQILGAHEIFQQKPNVVHALVDSMNKANSEITDYFKNQEGRIVSDTINKTYLKEISLENNPLSAKFKITDSELGRILEKLELIGSSISEESNIGLGSSNLLFIAAEMLLLKKDSSYNGLKLLLIEEIEAHIHPQSQINLIDFLNRHCDELKFQNIITSHSNSLASKIDLNDLIICKNGKAYSLHNSNTKLEKGDYAFLSRFLDDTKANLFFANGVLMVEGDAENLILPTLAEKIGLPLHKYGISIVNVGSTALFRYSKIFQRKDGEQIGIRVSCITDRDIPPKAAGRYTYEVQRRTGDLEVMNLLRDGRRTEEDYSPVELEKKIDAKKNKYRGGDVDVFIGNTWTLEYELANSVLSSLIHKSIKIAIKIGDGGKPFSHIDYLNVCRLCKTEIEEWRRNDLSDEEIAVEIYAPLERKLASKAVTAQVFAFLLRRDKTDKAVICADPYLQYLVNAIKYAAHV